MPDNVRLKISGFRAQLLGVTRSDPALVRVPKLLNKLYKLVFAAMNLNIANT